MRSLKWLLRLPVILSLAWIAFSNSESADTPGGASSPITQINVALSKLANLQTTLREKGGASILSELRNRGISIPSDGSSTSLGSLSDIAKSVLSSTDRQSATGVGQNSSPNLQSLIAQASQLDEQQVVSQLKTGFQRIVQDTGSSNAEPERASVLPK